MRTCPKCKREFRSGYYFLHVRKCGKPVAPDPADYYCGTCGRLFEKGCICSPIREPGEISEIKG